MRKRTWLLVVFFLLLSLSVLSACGSRQTAEEDSLPIFPAQPDTPQPDTPQPDTPQPDTPQPDSPQPDPALMEHTVQNNGGDFVLIDGNIYFRRYGKDALTETALWGKFLQYPTLGTSDIICWKPEEGSLETLWTAIGYDRLYFDGESFYTTEYADAESNAQVVRRSLDGKKRDVLCEGHTASMTETGLLLVEKSDSFGETWSFYLHGALVRELKSNDMSFLGLTDDGLFLTHFDYGEKLTECSIWFASTYGDNEAICLGVVPHFEGEENCNGVRVDQFISAPDKIGVAVGYTGGSGHFLAHTTYVQAVPGQADSVKELVVPKELIPELEEGYLDDYQMTMIVDGSGELAFSATPEGSYSVDENGLQIYENDKWIPLRTWDPLREDIVEDLLYGQDRFSVLSLKHLNGASYLILADSEYDLEASIGWRDAYRLLEMRYLMLPDGIGDPVELAKVVYQDTVDTDTHDVEYSGATMENLTPLSPQPNQAEKEAAPELPSSNESIYSGDTLLARLEGTWYFRPSNEAPYTAKLTFKDMTATIESATTVYNLKVKPIRSWYLYDWEPPNALDFEQARDSEMPSYIGHYSVDFYQTDGEELLCLTNVDNGGGTIPGMLPGCEWGSEVTFHRFRGTPSKADRREDFVTQAMVVKYDAEKQLLWIREAVALPADEYTITQYIPFYHAPCVSYQIVTQDVVEPLMTCDNPFYPMQYFQVTINKKQAIEKIQ